MRFNNREEIKEILQKDISNEEKRNLIANLKNYKTDLYRVISVDEELNLEIGQVWDNLGRATSWTDRNAEIRNMGFSPELGGEVEYVLSVEGIEGYKVQYLQFDYLLDLLSEEMEQEEAEELAYEISNDEVYLELMDLLGADADMVDEAEVLVPAETKMEIVEIRDCRKDEGYIEVVLREVK